MDSSIATLSASISKLAAEAAGKLFHVPSSAGGRSALGFDGRRLLVPAFQAEKSEELEILAPGGSKVGAKVVGFDPALGLAVLELTQALPASAWTAAETMPALASLALSVAYPSEDGPEARLGLVRIAHGSVEGEDSYIQLDGASFPGFSGAAIVGAEGSLAGMIVADRSGNRGWALPAMRAKALVDAIVARGFPSRAWLGLSTLPVDLPESLREAAGGPIGLLVTELAPKGPAQAAGLLPGDILVSAGGTRTEGPRSLRDALATSAEGERITLVILRGGLRMEIVALLAERPESPASDSEGAATRHHHGRHGHHEAGCGSEGCGCSTGR
ncbi:MAG TPA: S1C family serine protease [Rectinemataceae bacterium]|nr:S1C family serine protease [Rectinemataceae bacterium]